jgi:hypothetical protein
VIVGREHIGHPSDTLQPIAELNARPRTGAAKIFET